MNLERHLDRWTRAGLMGAEQAARILAFEQRSRRPLLSHALATLAGLAMAIGLVSIVASNWEAIPGAAKLGLDLLLVVGLGALVLHWDRRGPAWARETAIGVLYGLALASVALVGQVYQTGGQAYAALGTWTVLTALLMAQARSGVLALFWLGGVQTSYGFLLAHWAEQGPQAEGLALAAVYWMPLACLVLGRVRAIRERRPRLGRVLTDVGWAELVLLASAATFVFYDTRAPYRWALSLWLGSAPSLAVSVWLSAKLPPSPARLGIRALLLVAFVLCHACWHVPVSDLPLLSALLFLGLWLLVAVVAHRAGLVRWLNLATAVLGVRLVSVYFEVFGSLLDTGLGLVSGGGLTLALLWLWQRKRRQFEQSARERAS